MGIIQRVKEYAGVLLDIQEQLTGIHEESLLTTRILAEMRENVRAELELSVKERRDAKAAEERTRRLLYQIREEAELGPGPTDSLAGEGGEGEPLPGVQEQSELDLEANGAGLTEAERLEAFKASLRAQGVPFS